MKKRVGYSMFSTFGEGLESAWSRLGESLETKGEAWGRQTAENAQDTVWANHAQHKVR